MKLNIDCMRDVLLIMEEIELNNPLSFNSLKEKLPEYERNDLAYTCLKLYEAKFITMKYHQLRTSLSIFELNDITYEGHQFLANIRDKNI